MLALFSLMNGFVILYELQADIFDPLIAMARVFELEIHQSPASSGIRLRAR